MKRNYQGVLERIKKIALAHPLINSADDGRELEFDVKKTNIWPRTFIRTDSSPIVAGPGTVDINVLFTVLVMDRLKTDRSNVVDVLNLTHTALTDMLAVMNNEQLIRLEGTYTFTPIYDYQDSQSAGWSVGVNVWLDSGFECYEVPD